jgi:hypothetical protein
MMIVVVDDERKLYKIENYIVSTKQFHSFQVSKIFTVKLSFFSMFLIFQKNLFQDLVRRGVRGGAR